MFLSLTHQNRRARENDTLLSIKLNLKYHVFAAVFEFARADSKIMHHNFFPEDIVDFYFCSGEDVFIGEITEPLRPLSSFPLHQYQLTFDNDKYWPTSSSPLHWQQLTQQTAK